MAHHSFNVYRMPSHSETFASGASCIISYDRIQTQTSSNTYAYSRTYSSAETDQICNAVSTRREDAGHNQNGETRGDA
jgi:hypothetical protein